MTSAEQKLEELGFPVDRVPTPAGTYRPVVIDGTTGFVSGAVPIDGDAGLLYSGKVPERYSVEEAQKAAALCAANILRVVRAEVGSLERIERVLRLCVYVNSSPEFVEQHVVANGASQLVVDVLGDAGRHARSAVGVAQLPLGSTVEVDAIVRLRS